MIITDDIDIVVLNYNDDEHLEECLLSVMENTEGHYNLIVVDQGSMDNSRVILKRLKISHVVLAENNRGVSVGRNITIRASRTPWIVFVDSDLIVHDRFWLDKMWNFTLDEKIGFIEAASVNARTGIRELSSFSFCMLRRQCLNEVGWFDPRFFVGEDVEWFARLEDSTWKTGYCLDTEATHYCSSSLYKNFGGEDAVAKMRMNSDNYIAEKYTDLFLEHTLRATEKRRSLCAFELKTNRF